MVVVGKILIKKILFKNREFFKFLFCFVVCVFFVLLGAKMVMAMAMAKDGREGRRKGQ